MWCTGRKCMNHTVSCCSRLIQTLLHALHAAHHSISKYRLWHIQPTTVWLPHISPLADVRDASPRRCLTIFFFRLCTHPLIELRGFRCQLIGSCSIRWKKVFFLSTSLSPCSDTYCTFIWYVLTYFFFTCHFNSFLLTTNFSRTGWSKSYQER